MKAFNNYLINLNSSLLKYPNVAPNNKKIFLPNYKCLILNILKFWIKKAFWLSCFLEMWEIDFYE
ncbi:MAG: hypothetical protein COW71_08110 [Ignavibacteriales bacterium CG18_big_fil_WC_8_21_14_2_50_31_20]|nr:MAG: hypothetical protein COW71_08110 [Ignavibacteriales bacterium CG18_big_fil_WC_8_21_14_2_50_31_20]